MSFIVAIDGPAGSGKGTITKKIAKKMNLNCIDTGAMYRCVTLALIKNNIDITDLESVNKILQDIDIKIIEEKDKQTVLLNGEDVTLEIRDNPVNTLVPKVSTIKEVRLKLVEIQREMAKTQNIIMEGRDITTVVFPNADVKIYLDAALEERARRRHEQNVEKNIESNYEEVLEEMRKRDESDKNREFGALKIADDAIIVDSTNNTIDQTVEEISSIIENARKVKELEPKIYSERPENLRKRVVRKCVKVFLKTLYRIFYRIKITGEENKQIAAQNGGYIICANHLNYLDAAAVILFSKEKVRFVAKHDLGRIGILRWLFRLFDIIPIKREAKDLEAMKRCLKALKNNEIIAIFPEGTRKGLEKNVKVKNGAAFMAIRSGKQVLPVGISGTFKLFSKININYGAPIDMEKYQIKGHDKSEEKDLQEAATKEIMDNIIMLTNEQK